MDSSGSLGRGDQAAARLAGRARRRAAGVRRHGAPDRHRPRASHARSSSRVASRHGTSAGAAHQRAAVATHPRRRSTPTRTPNGTPRLWFEQGEPGPQVRPSGPFSTRRPYPRGGGTDRTPDRRHRGIPAGPGRAFLGTGRTRPAGGGTPDPARLSRRGAAAGASADEARARISTAPQPASSCAWSSSSSPRRATTCCLADNPIYDASYGLQGLREALDAGAGQGLRASGKPASAPGHASWRSSVSSTTVSPHHRPARALATAADSSSPGDAGRGRRPAARARRISNDPTRAPPTSCLPDAGFPRVTETRVRQGQGAPSGSADAGRLLRSVVRVHRHPLRGSPRLRAATGRPEDDPMVFLVSATSRRCRCPAWRAMDRQRSRSCSRISSRRRPRNDWRGGGRRRSRGRRGGEVGRRRRPMTTRTIEEHGQARPRTSRGGRKRRPTPSSECDDGARAGATGRARGRRGGQAGAQKPQSKKPDALRGRSRRR